MEIPLTRGHVAVIDDQDYPLITQYRWWVQKSLNTCYARGRKAGQTRGGVYMHRLIAGARAGETVDHGDRNGLNNRRSNLRICTRAQNMSNARLRRDSQSGYKGVCFDRRRRFWRADIAASGKHIALGHFASAAAAALAYDNAAREHHGEFAVLNFPGIDWPPPQPMRNALMRSNTSGYRGVTWSAACNKWKAAIRVNNKFEYLGVFISPEDAARAYDARAREARGSDAFLNFPEGE